MDSVVPQLMPVVPSLAVASNYRDQQYNGSMTERDKELARSSTLYVGNLAFYTTEEQIYTVFSKCGSVKRVIMGLDRNARTPCGFCFVEYYERDDALDCMRFISGTKLDERFIRCDLDPGFKPGRQFGRGKSGGQVRDEYRTEYDAGRGGYGHQQRQRMEADEHELRGTTHGHYDEALTGIVPSGASAYQPVGAKVSGTKRRRDDDEEDGEEQGETFERTQKNPRFREERDEDE